MGGLFCPLCGETLPEAGLHCPTCSTDVGWWLVRGGKADGPLELGELREALARGRLEDVEWIRLGAVGLHHKPEALAEIVGGADYPRWRLIEDWTDFRNLFRLALVGLFPLLALAAMMWYWLRHWPGR